jgi:putative flippase GtrA
VNRRKQVARWAKFNLVGIVGMALQLSALAAVARVFPAHPLGATAAAVEITLLHNFYWHLRYTWRDRDGGSTLAQCLRFHLSNGLVSLAGNLALMHVLIQTARLPLLISNGIAVLCCSILNFFLSDSWVFLSTPATRSESS